MKPLQSLTGEAFTFGVVALVFLVTVVFFAAIVYVEHRKEMKLIEAGHYEEARNERSWILAAGLLLTALGIADVVQAALLGVVPESGITLAMLGIAALVYYYVRRRQTRLATEASAEAATEGTD